MSYMTSEMLPSTPSKMLGIEGSILLGVEGAEQDADAAVGAERI